MATFRTNVQASAWRLFAGILLGTLPLPLACDGGGASPAPCVAGASSACACADGGSGAQICKTDGTFDDCVCGGTPDSNNGRQTDRMKDGGSTSASSPGGPVFLSLGTNVGSLTEDESVTITAVLTDPDGIDDLIGGSLSNEDGTVQYGAFVTSGQEGAYSLALSWSQINQAEPIFLSGSKKRIFSARFFDEAGHNASRTVAISLTCGDLVACDGVCKSVCKAQSETYQSCDATCSQAGMTCTTAVESCRLLANYVPASTSPLSYKLSSCSKTPTATAGGSASGSAFLSVDCCCTPP